MTVSGPAEASKSVPVSSIISLEETSFHKNITTLKNTDIASEPASAILTKDAIRNGLVSGLPPFSAFAFSAFTF
jgi:hypothetical protein